MLKAKKTPKQKAKKTKVDVIQEVPPSGDLSFAGVRDTSKEGNVGLEFEMLQTLKQLQSDNHNIMNRLTRLEQAPSTRSSPRVSPIRHPIHVASTTRTGLPAGELQHTGATEPGVLFSLPSPQQAPSDPVRDPTCLADTMTPGLPTGDLLQNRLTEARLPSQVPDLQQFRSNPTRDPSASAAMPGLPMGDLQRISRAEARLPTHVPTLQQVRSNPGLSTQAATLIASYEDRALQENLPGRQLRPKSGRFSNVENPLIPPHLRWANEGFVCPGGNVTPHFNQLTLPQFVAGQLANCMQVNDLMLLKSMLAQVADSMKDATSLPWPVVRAAWATSMNEVEYGRLQWSDTVRWALNRMNSSSVATRNAATIGFNSKRDGPQPCTYFNEGHCHSDSSHGKYLHICSHCFYYKGEEIDHRNCKGKAKPKSDSKSSK